MTGTTISHYKILEKLGQGGMGVVYRAEDTKLDRSVALKFLPAHLLGDEEVRKRFEREAKAAAALDHSNVCTVYEIDQADGKTFIAMAFVEGESLDKRIERGPLKLEDVLDIAQQIAQGLEAAHEKGVVHRDIKPQNVMVGSKGHVTIMDFGLAQLTQASLLTRPDQTMGTTFYMSPEQTEGSGTDNRTDIWSLGVVLYEMITGQQPFKGDYNKAVMYSILNEEPEPITGLRTGVPMELEISVGKCLTKQPSDRYGQASELGKDLRTLAEGLKAGRSKILVTDVASPDTVPEALVENARFVASSPPRAYNRFYQLAALAIIAAVMGWQLWTRPAPERPVRKFSTAPEEFAGADARAAISPDGKYIAHVAGTAQSSLYIRPLDQTTPRRIEGTEGAVNPFWAPDTQSIGFVANSELKRVALDGGQLIAVCALPGLSRYFEGVWSPDGESIVFAAQNPTRIYQVSASGGDPQVLIDSSVRSMNTASSPQFVSDHTLLYRVGTPGRATFLVARDLETDNEQEWSVPAALFTYSPTGHLLYNIDSTFGGDLWALPFSPDSHNELGDQFLLARNAYAPSVSSDGTLIYRQSPGARMERFRVVDRSGGIVHDTERIWPRARAPTFSSDGSTLIMSVLKDEFWHIWRYQLREQSWIPVIQHESSNLPPLFADRADQVIFSSTRRDGNFDIYGSSIEGRDAKPLVATDQTERPTDVDQSSGRILYCRVEPDERGRDIWYLEPDGNGGYAPQLFLGANFEEFAGAFSPDGQWVAYTTTQDGPYEVYVRKFPEGSPFHKVSRAGGNSPRWRADGRELFYVQGASLMAAEVTSGDTFSVQSTTTLFSEPSLDFESDVFRTYDVAPDGQSFVLKVPSDDAAATPPVIRVTENWYEEFRDRE